MCGIVLRQKKRHEVLICTSTWLNPWDIKLNKKGGRERTYVVWFHLMFTLGKSLETKNRNLTGPEGWEEMSNC